MALLKIQPECRYGHGALVSAENTPDPSIEAPWFAVMAVRVDGTVTDDASYIFRIYKCTTCTYMEMHDLPQQEFDDSIKAATKARLENQKEELQLSLQAVTEQETQLGDRNGS